MLLRVCVRARRAGASIVSIHHISEKGEREGGGRGSIYAVQTNYCLTVQGRGATVGAGRDAMSRRLTYLASWTPR